MRVAQHSILVRRCLVWWIGVISTIVLAATYTPLPQECVVAQRVAQRHIPLRELMGARMLMLQENRSSQLAGFVTAGCTVAVFGSKRSTAQSLTGPLSTSRQCITKIKKSTYTLSIPFSSNYAAPCTKSRRATHYRDSALSLARSFSRARSFSLSLARALSRALALSLARALSLTHLRHTFLGLQVPDRLCDGVVGDSSSAKPVRTINALPPELHGATERVAVLADDC